MKVLVLRHGEAEDTVPDFDRILTSEGRDAVARTCGELSAKGVSPNLVAASPLPRAQETAGIAVDETAPGITIESWPELESGADPASAARRLDAKAGTVLVVTHQPFASRLIEYLTGEDTPMKTAMVACVEGDVIAAGCCELKWTLRG